MTGVFRQYSWIIDVVGILLCSFFLAKISGIYAGKMIEVEKAIGIRGQAEMGKIERQIKPREDYTAIIDRNMFDPNDKKPEDVAPKRCEEGDTSEECINAGEQPIPTGEAVKTSLTMTVIGVLVVGDGEDKRSTATISGTASAAPKGRSGASSSGGGGGVKSGVYAVGAEGEEGFAPGTKLTKISPKRIEFLNKNRLEYADVGGEVADSIFGPPKRDDEVAAKGGTKAPAEKKGPAELPDKQIVDRREIQEMIDNPTQALMDMRAVPQYANGKVAGLKILQIKQGSTFSKLGMQRGDVLQRINGMDLDAKKALEMFSTLKDEKSIKLDILRNGQATTLEYEIR